LSQRKGADVYPYCISRQKKRREASTGKYKEHLLLNLTLPTKDNCSNSV